MVFVRSHMKSSLVTSTPSNSFAANSYVLHIGVQNRMWILVLYSSTSDPSTIGSNVRETCTCTCTNTCT
eukprot:8804312-Karenia_brevis.AAC.1